MGDPEPGSQNHWDEQLTPRILIVAGSDSGGGAGIQADIKTVTMLGGHASTAITAITAQNTRGVSAVHPVPAEIVLAQIDAVLIPRARTGRVGHADHGSCTRVPPTPRCGPR